MKGVARAVLISMIVSIALLMFSSFITFFPWYSTLVVETFNLSQMAAGDNYVKQTYYNDTLQRLKNKPIYKQYPGEIKIEIKNSDDKNAVGYDDETYYVTNNVEDRLKPYRQRGEPLSVKITATYPLSVTLWGRKITKKIENVSFTMKTVGLKHYKDLPYYKNLS